jgi:hypothetical protein
MSRERHVRGAHDDDDASFDWERPARARGVPLDEARALRDEAAGHGPRHARDLYLEWLDQAAARQLAPGKRTRMMRSTGQAGPGWLPEDRPRIDPGKRTRTMRLAAQAGLWPRLPLPDDRPVAPGRRARTDRLDAPGRLPAGLRARMEQAYGQRFDGVAVHADSSEVAAGHRGLARAGGIHLERGLDLDSDLGERVVAHELAHVVQQSRAGGGAPASRAALEADAQQAAASALAGRAASVRLAAPAYAALGFSEDEPAREVAAPRAPADGLLVPEAPAAITPTAAQRQQTVAAGNQQVARAVGALPGAEQQTSAARAAAAEPAAERDAGAQREAVTAVDRRPPPSPEIEAACARIREVIRARRPPSEDRLVDARPREMARAAGGQMSAGIEARADAVRGELSPVAPPPPAPSPRPPPAPTPPARVETPPVDAAAAAPDPLRADQVALDADVAAQRRRLDGAGMSTEPARLVTTGPIGDARQGVADLEGAAGSDPRRVLAQQAQAIAHAQGDMRALQARAEQVLAEARAGAVARIDAHTAAVTTGEEEQRARAGERMQALFTTATAAVDGLLRPLGAAAVARWEAGIATLASSFEGSLATVKQRIEARYRSDGSFRGEVSAGVNQLVDRFGLPDWVTAAYDRAEATFADGATALVTDIGRDVADVVDRCKQLVRQAREDIDRVASALPASLQAWAHGEATRLGGELDQVDARIDQTRRGLDRDLVQRAGAAVHEVREQVAALREAARGLVDRIAAAVDAFEEDPGRIIVDGLLEAVGIPPGRFWALIERLGNVVDGIAAEPMRFANTLMAGVGRGFEQFFHNLPAHLGQALFQWLFSKLGEAGVAMPTDFSVRSIVTLVLEVLGITWPRVRTILARHLGPEAVELLEHAYQLVATLIERGPEGLFEMLREQLDPGAIVDMIKEAALQYVMDTIVTRVAGRIVMMLNPAGAILQAIEAIYRVIRWVVDNAATIFTLVESVVNGAAAILAGNTDGVAGLVESSLVRLVVPVIDFLAGYLGLGGIPAAIRNLVLGLQARVEAILDRVVGFLVTRARALWDALRGRGGADAPTEGAQVPTSLVEPRPATLEQVSPQLGTALAGAASGTEIHRAATTDPRQVTTTLLAQHRDARLDPATGQLTLPPVSAGALAAATSLADLGRLIAQETGVSRVTLVRSGDSVRLEGHINPSTPVATLPVTSRIDPPIKIMFHVPRRLGSNPSLANDETGYSRDEVKRQLDGQAAGINRMTVAAWKRNRHQYDQQGRHPASAGQQADLRGRLRIYLVDYLTDPEPMHGPAPLNLVGRGDDLMHHHAMTFVRNAATRHRDQHPGAGPMPRDEALRQVDAWMGTQAVLHDPDQVAGGDGDALTGLGNSSVNSSIGSQWGNGRAEELNGKVDAYLQAHSIDATASEQVGMAVDLDV